MTVILHAHAAQLRNCQQLTFTSHFPKQMNSKANDSNDVLINSTRYAVRPTDCVSLSTAGHTRHYIVYVHSANMSASGRSSGM